MAILPPDTFRPVARCRHDENKDTCVRCAMDGARHRAHGLVRGPLRPGPARGLDDESNGPDLGHAFNLVAREVGDLPKNKMFRPGVKVTTPLGLAIAVQEKARTEADGIHFKQMVEDLKKMVENLNRTGPRPLAAGHRKAMVDPPSFHMAVRPATAPKIGRPGELYRIRIDKPDGQILYLADTNVGFVGIERIDRAIAFATIYAAVSFVQNSSDREEFARYPTTVVDGTFARVGPALPSKRYGGSPKRTIPEGPFGIRLAKGQHPALYAAASGDIATEDPRQAAAFHTLAETRKHLQTLHNWKHHPDAAIVDDYGNVVETAMAATEANPDHPLGWPAPPCRESRF